MKDHIRLLVLALCLCGIASATPAFASTYYFELTDNTTPVTFTFSLPSSPTPSNVYTDDFEIDPVDYAVNGVAQTPGFVAFYDSNQGGGLVLADSTETVLFGTSGDPVYTNSLSNPTFLLGTFPELGGAGSGLLTTDDVTLTISDSPIAATPEPGTLALLGTGAAGLLGILRRRRSLGTA